MTQPLAVLLNDIAPWIDDVAAGRLLYGLRAWLPAGHVISLIHAVPEAHPDGMARLTGIYRESTIAVRPRSGDAVAQLLASWPLPAPGLVPTSRWYVLDPYAALGFSLMASYAAVAFHPALPPPETCADAA